MSDVHAKLSGPDQAGSSKDEPTPTYKVGSNIIVPTMEEQMAATVYLQAKIIEILPIWEEIGGAKEGGTGKTISDHSGRSHRVDMDTDEEKDKGLKGSVTAKGSGSVLPGRKRNTESIEPRGEEKGSTHVENMASIEDLLDLTRKTMMVDDDTYQFNDFIADAKFDLKNPARIILPESQKPLPPVPKMNPQDSSVASTKRTIVGFNYKVVPVYWAPGVNDQVLNEDQIMPLTAKTHDLLDGKARLKKSGRPGPEAPILRSKLYVRAASKGRSFIRLHHQLKHMVAIQLIGLENGFSKPLKLPRKPSVFDILAGWKKKWPTNRRSWTLATVKFRRYFNARLPALLHEKELETDFDYMFAASKAGQRSVTLDSVYGGEHLVRVLMDLEYRICKVTQDAIYKSPSKAGVNTALTDNNQVANGTPSAIASLEDVGSMQMASRNSSDSSGASSGFQAMKTEGSSQKVDIYNLALVEFFQSLLDHLLRNGTEIFTLDFSSRAGILDQESAKNDADNQETVTGPSSSIQSSRDNSNEGSEEEREEGATKDPDPKEGSKVKVSPKQSPKLKDVSKAKASPKQSPKLNGVSKAKASPKDSPKSNEGSRPKTSPKVRLK